MSSHLSTRWFLLMVSLSVLEQAAELSQNMNVLFKSTQLTCVEHVKSCSQGPFQHSLKTDLVSALRSCVQCQLSPFNKIIVIWLLLTGARATLPSRLLPPPNGKLPHTKQLLSVLFYLHCAALSCVHCALCRSCSEDRTINLLTGSFVLLIAVPWEHCRNVDYFFGEGPCERQMFHPRVAGKQLWSHLLTCDRWFKICFVSFSKDWYLHCLVSTSCFCKEDWDRLFLSFGFPRRQGIGSDWPLGMNLFQVICSSQVKMQAWDSGLPGTFTATLDFVFFLLYFFCSACFPPPVELNLESYKQIIPLPDTLHLVP